jgi:hypothetical protein
LRDAKREQWFRQQVSRQWVAFPAAADEFLQAHPAADALQWAVRELALDAGSLLALELALAQRQAQVRVRRARVQLVRPVLQSLAQENQVLQPAPVQRVEHWADGVSAVQAAPQLRHEEPGHGVVQHGQAVSRRPVHAERPSEPVASPRALRAPLRRLQGPPLPQQRLSIGDGPFRLLRQG